MNFYYWEKISEDLIVYLAEIFHRGSGMSSSAAVEGGLAFALNEMFNVGLNRVELALLCQRAEHNFPNVKCGIMDQFANMNGKEGSCIITGLQEHGTSIFSIAVERV